MDFHTFVKVHPGIIFRKLLYAIFLVIIYLNVMVMVVVVVIDSVYI